MAEIDLFGDAVCPKCSGTTVLPDIYETEYYPFHCGKCEQPLELDRTRIASSRARKKATQPSGRTE